MINPYGRAFPVPADNGSDRTPLSIALDQGCRLVDRRDWEFLNSDSATFRCPWIEEHERGAWGDGPILVIGNGPSREATWKWGGRSIIVNPRAGSPFAQASLCIDEEAYADDGGMLPNYKYGIGRPLFIGPHGQKPASRPAYRFGFPVHPIGECKPEAVSVAVDGAISELRVSGIAAILVAQYLTAGPVVLTGFELGVVPHPHRQDEVVDYTALQLGGWRKALAVLENVYAHPDMTGPLVGLLPKWSE